MKNWKRIFVAALLFCLILPVVPAAALSENEKVISFNIDGDQLKLEPSGNEACFWECPALQAGQHRADGLLRLHNDSNKDATVTLKDFKLPTAIPEEMEYLEALNLTVSVMKNNAKETVYSGKYADIGDLQIVLDVPKGMENAVYFEIGCDFTYVGKAELSASIPYTIDATASSASKGFWGILTKIGIAVLVIAVVAAVVFLLIRLSRKKSKKSA